MDKCDLMDSHEVAEMLGVSQRTLNRWFRLRKGPPRIKVGRRSLYRRESVSDWLLALESSQLNSCPRVQRRYAQ